MGLSRFLCYDSERLQKKAACVNRVIYNLLFIIAFALVGSGVVLVMCAVPARTQTCTVNSIERPKDDSYYKVILHTQECGEIASTTLKHFLPTSYDKDKVREHHRYTITFNGYQLGTTLYPTLYKIEDADPQDGE